METKRRVLDVASVAFADRGVAATSLDWLAGELGITKQTVLYHYGSKDGLAREVFAAAADELLLAMAAAVDRSEPGSERIEATVRAAFALAVRRPELIGLLREAGRIGPPTSAVVLERLQPFVDSAIDYLDDGSPRRHLDARLVLVSAYTMVTGVVTDTEVLRAAGVRLNLRSTVRFRRTLLSFLQAALLDGSTAATSTELNASER